jgi:hypothetical protein
MSNGTKEIKCNVCGTVYKVSTAKEPIFVAKMIIPGQENHVRPMRYRFKKCFKCGNSFKYEV